ncbi:MAG: 50S ribosomal protein L29 [Candidatus Woesearchaeota archaeon]
MRIKQKELELMSKAELVEKLNELRKELMKKNAEIATGTIPKNAGEIKQLKKNIARVMLSINRKEVKNEKQ